MIGSGPAYRTRRAQANYLAGNAKVYDGAFDYDLVNSWEQIDRLQPFTMNFHAFYTPAPTTWLFAQGDLETAIGLQVAIVPTLVQIIMRASASNSIVVNFPLSEPINGYNSLIITYDGSSNANGLNVYLNSVQLSRSIVVNALSSSIISIDYTDLLIGQRSFGNPTQRFSGRIKIYEVINRVATAGEIAGASMKGSFRGAGISHASGQYRLAVDFDKVDGQAPTTFAGTPTYTITPFGGATYVPYL